jgi:hypothetical protein
MLNEYADRLETYQRLREWLPLEARLQELLWSFPFTGLEFPTLPGPPNPVPPRSSTPRKRIGAHIRERYAALEKSLWELERKHGDGDVEERAACQRAALAGLIRQTRGTDNVAEVSRATLEQIIEIGERARDQAWYATVERYTWAFLRDQVEKRPSKRVLRQLRGYLREAHPEKADQLTKVLAEDERLLPYSHSYRSREGAGRPGSPWIKEASRRLIDLGILGEFRRQLLYAWGVMPTPAK